MSKIKAQLEILGESKTLPKELAELKVPYPEEDKSFHNWNDARQNGSKFLDAGDE